MFLSGFPPLGGGGPAGHFLAAALPHGLLCWQLLGAVDREPRTRPALPGTPPACAGEGRQGLPRREEWSIPSDACRGRRQAAATGNACERDGRRRRRGTLTKVCNSDAGGIRAPFSSRDLRGLQLQRRGSGATRSVRRSRVSGTRPALAAPHPSACSWERSLALRPAFRVLPAFWLRPSRNSTSARGEAASVPSGALPRTMAAPQPLRVLCLAGFRQSERGFREKTGALRKALRGRAELVCLSGPHPVVDTAGAGPESGERSPAPEMRSEASLFSLESSLSCLVSKTLFSAPPLYPHSILLSPSHFILPIPFISFIPASHVYTLICSVRPSLCQSINQSIPNLRLASRSVIPKPSLSHFFPPASPLP